MNEIMQMMNDVMPQVNKLISELFSIIDNENSGHKQKGYSPNDNINQSLDYLNSLNTPQI